MFHMDADVGVEILGEFLQSTFHRFRVSGEWVTFANKQALFCYRFEVHERACGTCRLS